MYLPLAAVLVLVVVAAEYGAKRYRRPHPALAMAGLGLLALPLGVVAARRNRVYRNEQTLYADTLEKLPGNLFNRYNYAKERQEAGDLAAAVVGYQALLQLAPETYFAYDSLGNAERDLGRPADAEAAYRKALRINPNLEQARYNLGKLLLQSGRKTEAEEQFNAAVLLDPQDLEARREFEACRKNSPDYRPE
jgi:tetratricopeptide (TPR) repeat protein